MDAKETKQNELLKLNLQFFAEEGGEEQSATESTEEATGDNPDNKQTSDEDTDASTTQDAEEAPKFTQADLDRFIQERLDRERKKQEREKEKAQEKAKEEQGEFKELYEKERERREQIEQSALDAQKESLLAKAGYDESQVERYKKYLDGESDAELGEALDALKEDIPPKKNYGDPNPGNNAKTPPKKTNLEDKGKSAYQRLKEKGKIRGASNK